MANDDPVANEPPPPRPAGPDVEEPAYDEQVRPIMFALFDVLGFSERLERDGLKEVAKTYDDLINGAVTRGSLRCIGLRRTSDDRAVGMLFALPDWHAYFSDTIVFWVELQPHFVAPFLQRCADFVCQSLLSLVPVRGAIALGEALMAPSKGVYIGSPIVEAARLEPRLGWIGCTFGESCAWPPFFPEADPSLILEYHAPLKDSDTQHQELLPVHLDWPRRWRDTTDVDLVKHLTTMGSTSPHPYLEEAIAFARYSFDEHDWFDRPSRPEARFRMTRVSDLPERARKGPKPSTLGEAEP